MTREPTALDRLRERCADDLAVVLVVLVLLVAISGWMTYAAYATPTETSEREIGALETEGEFEYAATVERENPVFPVGTELDDRDQFFRTVSPVLDGTYTYSFAGTNAENVTAETELALRLRSTDGDTVYWEETNTLGTDRVEADDGTGTLSVPFEVNVTETDRRVAAIEDALGRSPGDTEVAVVARTTVTGTVAGEGIEENHTQTLAIESSGSVYRANVDDGERRTAVTEPAVAALDRGPLPVFGSALLFVLSTAVLGLVVGLHRRKSLRPPADVRVTVARAREREALDDWITVGRVPSTILDGRMVVVDSLGDLVDVAIDSNRRVIDDPKREHYFVVTDAVVYTYSVDGFVPPSNVREDERPSTYGAASERDGGR